MSQNSRDFVRIWVAIFVIALLYRIGQRIAFHEAVTWHGFVDSVIQGSPVATILTIVSGSRIQTCGWKQLPARIATLQWAALFCLNMMLPGTIILISLLFEHPERDLTCGAVVLFVFVMLYVGCDAYAKNLIHVQKRQSIEPIPAAEFATTIGSDTYQEGDRQYNRNEKLFPQALHVR